MIKLAKFCSGLAKLFATTVIKGVWEVFFGKFSWRWTRFDAIQDLIMGVISFPFVAVWLFIAWIAGHDPV